MALTIIDSIKIRDVARAITGAVFCICSAVKLSLNESMYTTTNVAIKSNMYIVCSPSICDKI